MEVKFQFVPGQKVKTPFDDLGIIGMCGVDDNKQLTYYVRRSTGSQWFKETELTACE